jgi:hypothetical protein
MLCSVALAQGATRADKGEARSGYGRNKGGSRPRDRTPRGCDYMQQRTHGLHSAGKSPYYNQ